MFRVQKNKLPKLKGNFSSIHVLCHRGEKIQVALKSSPEKTK